MNKSPLRWVTKGNLARLRKMTVAVLAWEKSARRGVFYPTYSFEILDGSLSLHWAEVLSDMKDRAWDRLRQRENWTEIHAAYEMYWLLNNDRGAYETRKLREEVAELRARVEAGRNV